MNRLRARSPLLSAGLASGFENDTILTVKTPGGLPRGGFNPATRLVDLHIHSAASDGSLLPQEIVKAAAAGGLDAISITDHDTLEGAAEVLAAPSPPPLEILSGIELSTEDPAGSMHILGYMVRIDDPALNLRLKDIQEGRASRNVRIVAKLQDVGIEISYDEVLRFSGRGQAGRPHIAQLLVKKGAAKTVDQAFMKFLKKGRPAYFSRYRLTTQEAIETILRAGGVPVLAHPFILYGRDETAFVRLLSQLKDKGLQGLEVYYPEHSARMTAELKALAYRYHLVITGGTDFHGSIKPEISLGIGRGNLQIPYELVAAMKERAAAISNSEFRI